MSAGAHVPVCTYIESAEWCVWSTGEAQDKLSGHPAVFPVLLCLLPAASGQGSSLSPSDSGNPEGHWFVSDLRSYIQTSCEQGWTPRKERE